MPPVETLHARSTPAKAGSADIRLLALEDHLRFVVTHWLVHGAWRPSGLCDVAAMVEAVPADFDWALCLGDDEVVAGWIGATIMLAHRLLGCRLDTAPPALRVDPPAWFERAVLREWEAPYPGRFRSIAASGLAKHPGQFLHWLRVCWSTPVAALFEARLPVNSRHVLPHQVRIFARKLAKGSIEYLGSKLRAVTEATRRRSPSARPVRECALFRFARICFRVVIGENLHFRVRGTQADRRRRLRSRGWIIRVAIGLDLRPRRRLTGAIEQLADFALSNRPREGLSRTVPMAREPSSFFTFVATRT